MSVVRARDTLRSGGGEGDGQEAERQQTPHGKTGGEELTGGGHWRGFIGGPV